jgi:transcriptional regulator with XRE-family HTH domain
MDWTEYVAAGVAGRNQGDIAVLVGVSQSTVSRWARGVGGQPSVENVMSFARAVGDTPVAGLLAAGYLRHDELDGVIRLSTGLSDATTDSLLTELGRRLGLHVSVRKGATG